METFLDPQLSFLVCEEKKHYCREYWDFCVLVWTEKVAEREGGKENEIQNKKTEKCKWSEQC